MTRPKEASPATQRMMLELAERGVHATSRMIEGWASRGLAPAPVRRSLGRGHGTTSAYPPDAVDHYAAVASVMRRGRPWQVSVLMLLVHGYLPADRKLVRRAFLDLLEPPEALPGQDALDRAEMIAAEVARTPFGHMTMRAFERNLRSSAEILEPGTPIRPVALGVMATLSLASAEDPKWSPEALVEMVAAYGVPVAGMSDADRSMIASFAEAFFTKVISVARLADAAADSSLERIQAAVSRARLIVEEAVELFGGAPGEDVKDVLIAMAALVLVRIEDFGGDEAIAALADVAAGSEHAAA